MMRCDRELSRFITGNRGSYTHVCITQHMDISQSIENIMDGKDYQIGSIKKDGNRQRNSATIQDKEITISRTSYET